MDSLIQSTCEHGLPSSLSLQGSAVAILWPLIYAWLIQTRTHVLECVLAAPTLARILPGLLIVILLTEFARFGIVCLQLRLLQWVISQVLLMIGHQGPGWLGSAHTMIMDVLSKVIYG